MDTLYTVRSSENNSHILKKKLCSLTVLRSVLEHYKISVRLQT